ncbi:MAG: hypothetical protein RLZZ400_140 [Actinomycetota bacterium]|jgi:3-methyladenine DNA glycosylase AlkD
MFFKTGPGEYGEGDLFIGVTVPNTRAVSKRYRDLPLEEIDVLLDSKIHEHRLAGLVILGERFKRAKSKNLRGELFDFYVSAFMRGRVNNWDLVDVSAPIFGQWLVDYPKKTFLLNLARSNNLWQKRISIMFTFAHIRSGDFGPTQHLSMILLNDDHDLIHKAVGWMLREMGKRDVDVLRAFLAKHHRQMPRTMLRYAIEKLDANERRRWMS